ncbi:hypothetical protein CENSYa_1113 [Cenarchaeum symbiosum A]|uniref:Uncharacterized protein n=1 Tax=Cenarchaeum symbiosum (strain A) TaxID=414004 RepID=A0RWM5_CENSY|nr:hypothetical protein CENSYa_1113 [Cenarchaeum symbiosum A]
MIVLFCIGIISIVNLMLIITGHMQMITYREESKIRYRAWLGRAKVEKITLDGNMIKLPIYNHGVLAALRVTIRRHVSEKEEYEFGEFQGKSFDVTPGETVTLDATISDDEAKSVRNNGELYFGWRVEYYKYGKKKKKKDIGVYEIRGMIKEREAGIITVYVE